MTRYLGFVLMVIIASLFVGCPGIGKIDKEAADQAMTQIKEAYGDKIKDVKIYRDKLELALPTDMINPEKAQIFQDAARFWWAAYPSGKKPRHTLYCFVYNDVITGDEDDKIGQLTITRGLGDNPKVKGEPGIYALRDVK